MSDAKHIYEEYKISISNSIYINNPHKKPTNIDILDVELNFILKKLAELECGLKNLKGE